MPTLQTGPRADSDSDDLSLMPPEGAEIGPDKIAGLLRYLGLEKPGTADWNTAVSMARALDAPRLVNVLENGLVSVRGNIALLLEQDDRPEVRMALGKSRLREQLEEAVEMSVEDIEKMGRHVWASLLHNVRGRGLSDIEQEAIAKAARAVPDDEVIGEALALAIDYPDIAGSALLNRAITPERIAEIVNMALERAEKIPEWREILEEVIHIRSAEVFANEALFQKLAETPYVGNTLEEFTRHAAKTSSRPSEGYVARKDLKQMAIERLAGSKALSQPPQFSDQP